jgi:hypothetical protein
MKKPARGGEVKMKKTSIAVPDELWRRFRASNMLAGRESQEVITELIEAHLAATPAETIGGPAKKKGKNHGSR